MQWVFEWETRQSRRFNIESGKTMNGYKAYWKGKEIEVYANTSFEAQRKAAEQFKAKKAYEVTVMLCETGTDGSKPGEQVIHTPFE